MMRTKTFAQKTIRKRIEEKQKPMRFQDYSDSWGEYQDYDDYLDYLDGETYPEAAN